MTDLSATPIALALGSNLGDRAAHLTAAVAGLCANGVAIGARSGLYATEPVGGPPQGWFLNAALTGTYPGTARELLAACLDVERRAGRQRLERNGPRTADIDIIFYGDAVIDEPTLHVPHPRLQNRLFVLRPLAEVAPEWLHPVLGRTVAQLLAACPDGAAVAAPSNWPAAPRP